MSVRMGRVLIAVLGYALVIFGASACDSFAEEFFPTATSASVPTPTHAPSSIPTPRSTPTVIVVPTPTSAAKDPEFPAEPTYQEEAEEATTEDQGNDTAGCIPSLLLPIEGAIMDNGRLDRADDAVWDFDWSDCPGATRYHLYVIGEIATYPLLDSSFLTNSSSRFPGSAGYFTEDHRHNWTWKVRAMVGGEWVGREWVGGQWGGWSEPRSFDVEPADTDPGLEATGGYWWITISGSDFPPGKPVSIWVNSINATPGEVLITDAAGGIAVKVMQMSLPPPWTVKVEAGSISASTVVKYDGALVTNKFEEIRTYEATYPEAFTPSSDCDLGTEAFNLEKPMMNQPRIYFSKAALYADGVDDLSVCVVALQDDILPQQIKIFGHATASTAPDPEKWLLEVDFSGLPKLVDQAKLDLQQEYKYKYLNKYGVSVPIAHVSISPDELPPGVEGLQLGRGTFTYSGTWKVNDGEYMEITGWHLSQNLFTSQQNVWNRAAVISPGTKVTKVNVSNILSNPTYEYGQIYQTPHALIMEDVDGDLWFGPDRVKRDNNKDHPVAFSPVGSIPLYMIQVAHELFGDWADYYVTAPRRKGVMAGKFVSAGFSTEPKGALKVRALLAPVLFFGNSVIHEMQHEFSCYQPYDSEAREALCGNFRHWTHVSTIHDALSPTSWDYRDGGFCRGASNPSWGIASIFTLYEMGVADITELPPFYYTQESPPGMGNWCSYSGPIQFDNTFKVEPEELAEWAGQATYKSDLRGRSHYNVAHLIYSRVVLTDAEVAAFDLVARDFGKTTWDKWGVLPLGFYTQGRVVAHTLLGE